jgi:uncharacterized membrane protein
MKKITTLQKNWLLSLHILFSSIMFGGNVVFLIASISAATTSDQQVFQACYTIMHLLSKTTVRASAVGTVVTGILLSVWTHWGLLKYYWIIAKEVLTLFSVALGVVGIYMWTKQTAALSSAQGFLALHDPVFTSKNSMLWIGIVLQIISLAALIIISVFKPWGKRKRA